MIEISKLKPEDKGRAVVYRATLSSSKPEKGVITSWNENYIFVRYNNPYATDEQRTGTATRPEYLSFQEAEPGMELPETI